MSDDFMAPTPSDSGEKSGVTTNIPRGPEAFVGELAKSQLIQSRKVYSSRKRKGVVLYSNVIQLNKFINDFEEEFVTYVLGSKTTSKSDLPKGVSFIYESIVYVPEISGCLPFPDMSLIAEFTQKLRDEVEGLEPDPDFKKLSKKSKISKYDKFRKSLDRLDRFPRFYSTTKSTARKPSVNQTVIVSFLDNEDWISSGILHGMTAK